jgi:hypothetical protein
MTNSLPADASIDTCLKRADAMRAIPWLGGPTLWPTRGLGAEEQADAAQELPASQAVVSAAEVYLGQQLL